MAAASDDWRLYMMYFLVDKHDICVTAISEFGYSTCGVLLETSHISKHTNGAHYSGNFWWSTAGWIKAIDDVEEAAWEDSNRMVTERYLLRGVTDADELRRNHLEVHRVSHNLYASRTPRSSYINDVANIDHGRVRRDQYNSVDKFQKTFDDKPAAAEIEVIDAEIEVIENSC